MNPDQINSRQAKAFVMSTCTTAPQRDEVFEVRKWYEFSANERGQLVKAPQIWVMRRLGFECLVFTCYPHCQIKRVKGRIKLIPQTEGRRNIITFDAWDRIHSTVHLAYLCILCTYGKRR